MKELIVATEATLPPLSAGSKVGAEFWRLTLKKHFRPKVLTQHKMQICMAPSGVVACVVPPSVHMRANIRNERFLDAAKGGRKKSARLIC